MTYSSSNTDFLTWCLKIKLHLSNYYIYFLAPAAEELDVAQTTKKSLISSHLIFLMQLTGVVLELETRVPREEMVSPFLEGLKKSIDVAHWDTVVWCA